MFFFLNIVLFCFAFSFSENYIKILIRTKKLEKEKEEAIEAILTQIVQAYDKFNDSRDNHAEGLKSFTDNIIDAYGVLLVTVRQGSVIVILDCPTLKSLEHLWSDYLSGHLNKVAQRCLLTEEMRKKLNLEAICLKTTITEENYLICKKALMELPRTCSGEFKQSVLKVQLNYT